MTSSPIISNHFRAKLDTGWCAGPFTFPAIFPLASGAELSNGLLQFSLQPFLPAYVHSRRELCFKVVGPIACEWRALSFSCVGFVTMCLLCDMAADCVDGGIAMEIGETRDW